MNKDGKNIEGIRLEELFPLIEEKLKSGGEITFKPHGISMLPLIRQGKDSVTIRKMTGEPKRFDVIFYRREDGQFVLHRIIGRDKNGFVLCGDNQFVKEKGVLCTQIIGVMTCVLKEGKKEILCESSAMKVYCRLLFLRRLYLRARNLYRRAIRRLSKKTV